VRVIGVDPGTAHFGFAVLDVHGGSLTERTTDLAQVAIVELGTFETPVHHTIRDRVDEIAVDVAKLLRGHHPACVVAETPHGSRQAKVAAMLWGAYGALLGICAVWGVYLVERSPDNWRGVLGMSKRGTGEAARKREIREWCKARFDKSALDLALADVPGNARQHAFDALAIACTWADNAPSAARKGKAA
jgi:Holliday junction resolvasome RuvABC endonuclease subunit